MLDYILSRQLRNVLFTVLIIATLIPAMVLSVYFVIRIDAFKRADLNEQLALRSARLVDLLEHHLEVFNVKLEVLADNPDIEYRTRSDLFHNSLNLLIDFQKQNPLAFSVHLLDLDLQLLEAAPPIATIYELPPMTAPLEEIFDPLNQLARNYYVHGQFPQFLDESYLLAYSDGRKPTSAETLFVIAPIYIVPSRARLETILNGYMLSVVTLESIQALFDSAVEPQTIVEILRDGKLVGPPPTFADEEYVSSTADFTFGELDYQFRLSIPSSAGLAAIREERQLLGLIIVCSAIVTMLLSYYLARLFIKPISKLDKVVSGYADGQYDQPPAKLSFQELQQIASVLNAMGMRILEEQQTLEQRVEQRTRELKTAQQQLVVAEKMALLGQLVAGIAHEINTPIGVALTGVTFQAQQLKSISDKVGDNKIRKSELLEGISSMNEMGDLVQVNLERASHLINNFKQVAADQQVHEQRRICLAEYLREILHSLHPQLKKKKVKTQVLGEETLEVVTFPGVFAHMLSNLVMNSVQHGFVDRGDDCQIELEFVRNDETIELHYRDSGCGMTEEQRLQVFDPFYTTKRGQGGTGLGMHIVFNQVAQVLRGTIHCLEAEVGVHFLIKFPFNADKSAL